MIDSALFVGPRLKVERAHRHIQELIDRSSPLDPSLWTIETVDRSRYVNLAHINPQRIAEYVIQYRPLKPVAEEFALVIGDVVHNCRGALDHLATGMVAKSPWTAQVHFPMRKKKEHLISDSGEPISDLDTIEAALPGFTHLLLDEIRPSNGPQENLWSFHDLDNRDKHNLLIPTITVVGIGLPVVKTGTNASIGGHFGFNVAHLFYLFGSDLPFTIEGDFELSVEIKFGEGTAFENEPVVPTLFQIVELVSNTIDAVERLALR